MIVLVFKLKNTIGLVDHTMKCKASRVIKYADCSIEADKKNLFKIRMKVSCMLYGSINSFISQTNFKIFQLFKRLKKKQSQKKQFVIPDSQLQS